MKNNYKSGVGLKCFCCGKTGHFKRECKFKHASCFKCGQKGHLREMCRSKRQRENNNFKVFKVSSFKDNPALFNNNLSDLSWDRGKSYVSSECTVRDCETFVVERVEPYRVNVTVNSEIVNFIVDTGSELI